MVTPITRWPCSTSSAAATDESTPPDMATSTVRFSIATTPSVRFDEGERAHPLDERRQRAEHAVDLLRRRLTPQREADGRTRDLVRDPHLGEHVRRGDGTA